MATTNSDYLETTIINAYLRNVASGQVATLYLAIYTANPNFETGAGGAEATGGGYVRKACAFDAPTGGATANSAQIEWTCGTDIAVGTYTGWAIWDHITASTNLYFGDAFGASRTLASGDKLRFNAGGITYSLT